MDRAINKIKSFFSTPKRAILTILVLLIIFAVLGTIALIGEVYWDMHEDRIEFAIEEKIRGLFQ